MHTALFYSFCLLFTNSIDMQSSVEHLRHNYPLATKEAEICEAQIKYIEASESSSPLEMAYQGAYHMLWAKYLTDPLHKLNSFKKGKKLMEKAIKQRPGEPEIRFLRLTIQYHAPGILKYNKDISQDLALLLKNWDGIPESTFKENMKDFLVTTELLDSTQRKKLEI